MNTELRELILKLIEKNSRLEVHDLAVMLDVQETEVANEIAEMEKEHIICGYHTVINWDNTSKDQLTAMIEVKVTPQSGQGFDKIAERIYNFPEVKAVYLMSGGYDFMVMLEAQDNERNFLVYIFQAGAAGICSQHSNTFCFEEIQRPWNNIGSEKVDERQAVTP